METRLESGAYRLHGLGAVDYPVVGKRTLEWDSNNWKWDGDLFVATPLNRAPSNQVTQHVFPRGMGNFSNGSSCSGEVNLQIENGKRELEKRRRAVVVEDDNLNQDEAGTLSLKLGGQDYPISDRDRGKWEGMSGKKTKLVGGTTSRAVCQVENCVADLSNAKDYHRRHKVCEMHSKASKALVGNVLQRFCQQCSRFHVLQEFDEGKRSCRRRLAGHNKRRRKTNPDAVANGNTLKDDQNSGYLLMSLLRILSNMHSNKSELTTDQDLLSHLLRSLASHSAEQGGRNVPGLSQEHQDLMNDGNSIANSEVVTALHSNCQRTSSPFKQNLTGPVSEMPQQGVCGHVAVAAPSQTFSAEPSMINKLPSYSEVRDTIAGQPKINNFDLNNTYIDSDDGIEDIEISPVTAHPAFSSLDCPSWRQQDSHQLSPPQTSRNSDSVSEQSPSGSSGSAQSRTDRIVFKLFEKEPNDLPIVLRAQILDWLSHSPTDIESYIRPGCIILTIYLRQAEDAWEELCSDLGSSLGRLLDVSDDTFWRAGWLFIRVQHQIAFIYNGQVVVDRSLHLRSDNSLKILSVTPIAVSACESVHFSVEGVNLSQPAARLLCAVEGKYLLQEATQDLLDTRDSIKEKDQLHSLNFACSITTVIGRGFIEIEDHGFGSSFFPFIVAEEDVCTEIRMLESAIKFTEIDADVEVTGKSGIKNQAMDFLHELGWLLHRSQLKCRLGHLDPDAELFALRRFKWLMEFSMDHEWCAVVKKLLNLLLDGTAGAGDHPTLILAISELGLLHRAVRRNSRSLVELLLRYIPEKVLDKSGSEHMVLGGVSSRSFLFRPDASDPAGLTPLHIAAGKDGSENVLDALIDDPGMVGIEAWKSACDTSGFTPEDYARLRGHYSYIHLVQRKINKTPAAGHVTVEIPDSISDCKDSQKQKAMLATSFEIGQTELRPRGQQCKLCASKWTRGVASRSMVHRPAMLALVTIAAVCVCVALLFKSNPEVNYVFRPFRWEMLEYGTS